MEEKMINDNVEVFEQGVEEIAEAVLPKDNLLKYGAYTAIGAAVATGCFYGYKKVVKPGISNFKAKRAAKKAAKFEAQQEVDVENEFEEIED